MGTESEKNQHVEQQAASIFGGLRRWSAVCFCSALFSTSGFAAEPFHRKIFPVDWSREKPVIQKAQDIPLDFPSQKGSVAISQPSQGAISQPEPLDLPLSGFGGWKRSELPVMRPELPKASQSAASRYFDSPGKTIAANPAPAIAVQDYLQVVDGSAAENIAPPSANNLLPPEPTIGGSSPMPIPASANDIPGLEDTVFRPISQIQPYYTYSPTGKKTYEYLCPQPSSIPDDQRARCPDFLPLPAGGSLDRQFGLIDYQWCASDLKHKPLYFEDVSLERYGHQFHPGIQPFVSIAKFGVQGIGLPYQMAIDPVWRDVYALGYYRPGDNAPQLIYQVPFNLKAAAAAGGVYTGLIFLIP